MRWTRVVGLAAGVALIAPAAAFGASAPPQLDATAATVVDARDGHAIYKDDVDAQTPIASATKLMTALVSLEKLQLDQVLAAAPYHPDAAESVINLRPGERMKVADLLRGLLLESANDAAVTLARGAGGSQERFVQLMNRRAKRLGLRNTHYANPIGLDDSENYSSARDLARLTRVLMRDQFFKLTVKMPSARLLSGSYPRTIKNRNDLVGKYPWITGVKTGHTQRAGYVLVGSGTRNDASLISVVLDAPSESARNQDTLALLDYGFSLYHPVEPVKAGSTVDSAKVKYFSGKTELTPKRNVKLAVRADQRVRTVVDAPSQLEGPIDAGARVGRVAVLVDGKRVESVPLLTAEKVPGASVFRKLADFLLRPWLLIAAVAVGLLLFWRRRRRRAVAEEARRRRRQAARLD